MGFYPKHLKVKRYHRNMRIIATAALSGATFVTYDTNSRLWCVRYSDGKESFGFRSKSDAAAQYLVWWFDKQNMWPKRPTQLTNLRRGNYRGGN